MHLESLLGAGQRTVMVGQSKVGIRVKIWSASTGSHYVQMKIRGSKAKRNRIRGQVWRDVDGYQSKATTCSVVADTNCFRLGLH